MYEQPFTPDIWIYCYFSCIDIIGYQSTNWVITHIFINNITNIQVRPNSKDQFVY